MNILKVIKKVITEPTDFFKRVGKGKKYLGFAFCYYALLSLFGGIMGAIIYFLIISPLIATFLPFPFEKFGIGKYSWIVLSYILGLGLSFVYAGLLHIWIKIFGGKNNYIKTYELGAYAGTPAMLIGWIPFIGGLAGSIWSLVLLIIGTQHVHSINKLRAILMYVIPLSVILILSLFFWIFIFLLFKKTGIPSLIN